MLDSTFFAKGQNTTFDSWLQSVCWSWQSAWSSRNACEKPWSIAPAWAKTFAKPWVALKLPSTAALISTLRRQRTNPDESKSERTGATCVYKWIIVNLGNVGGVSTGGFTVHHIACLLSCLLKELCTIVNFNLQVPNGGNVSACKSNQLF